MDAAKKVVTEKRIVMGLLAVFAIAFVLGPLKSLGLLGRGASLLPSGEDRPNPTVGTVNVKPLGVMLQEGWKKMDPESQSVVPQAAARPEAPPVYTAHTLRDPLRSLLPQEQPVGPAGATGAPPVQLPTPPVPPPTLRIKGVVWGGVEPRAIINDHVYGVNDMVEGVRILSIDRQGVAVEREGTRFYYSVSSAVPRLTPEQAAPRQAHQ